MRLEGDIINRLIRQVFSVAFLIFLPMGSYSQNAVSIYRAIRGFRATTRVCRTTTVRISNFYPARQALAANPQYRNFTFTNTNSCIRMSVEQQILHQQLKSPTTIYGPYNYVRAISTVAKNRDLVNPRYLSAWKYINQSTGYNGVHHIVTKAVIERIHADLKASGKKVSLSDMQKNAPSLFHPFHGNPAYQDVFHNIDEQYTIYKEHGMRALMVHQLELINDINIKIGLEPFPDWYIDGILKETQLWCKHFGIDFGERPPMEGIIP